MEARGKEREEKRREVVSTYALSHPNRNVDRRQRWKWR